MLQTYQGYFQNGQFFSPELVTIPDNTEVHITIVGGTSTPTQSKARQQHEAVKRFFAAIDAIEDEPITDDDIIAFGRSRVSFSRELSV